MLTMSGEPPSWLVDVLVRVNGRCEPVVVARVRRPAGTVLMRVPKFIDAVGVEVEEAPRSTAYGVLQRGI